VFEKNHLSALLALGILVATPTAHSAVKDEATTTTGKNSKITVKNHSEQSTLVITFSAKEDADIRAKVRESLAKIKTCLDKQKKKAGLPFVRYMAEAKIESTALEAGYFVKASCPGSTEIKSSKIPASDVATFVHTGPYGNELDVMTVLKNWVNDNDKTMAGNPWQVFKTDPKTTPAAKTQIEYFIPIEDDL